LIKLYLLLLAASSYVMAETLRGKSLIITTAINEPYFMKKDNFEELEGNNRFEGLVVDLLDELSADLGFSYTIKLVGDGSYGTLPESGSWTGMIGDLLRGEADMAAADITVTSRREMVVDFTLPYMYSGLSILYTKNGNNKRNFHSLEELACMDSVKVGTFAGGSTMHYFMKSRAPVDQRIWAKMENDGTLVRSNSEGIQRVLDDQGGYAFIMEAPSAEYYVARNCDLTSVGKVFSERAYGLALPQGSPYRKEINVAILKLRESDRIDLLIQKWFHAETCRNTSSSNLPFMIDWILEMF